ncbi:uncharacterized protein LOC126661652 [Mercurialis annua]|uniref:uncharacterized protein LOC126661652 n=1 Tax=Mercurialis annua TaxID=3986 RepID=UPI00215F770E|nr:uncharacterized protein LOC126661652 [Mercurialis annua]
MEEIMEANNLAEVLDAEELEQAPPWIDDEAIHVREELEEVNLGTSEEPQRNLRTLVEHRLPIKPEFQPYRQLQEECQKKHAKYSNWLANVVPVVKKNGKLRICIDFRYLNEATPKDIYAMPIADTLIDATTNHSLFSFMDCFAGYNQIMVAKEDISKTAFRCPTSIGTFEWVVMPFGLRNAGATYQRAMNTIFHDLLGKTMEVYINDVVVKSKLVKDHLKNLEEAFRRMRVHCLKLNPLKCAFGVKAGIFLGFLVHERGIEVDQNKTKAIREAKPLRNKTELQRFLGQPPVLMPPKKGIPLRLYISAAEGSIGCLLAQSNQDGHVQTIYYLSRSMTSTEKPVKGQALADFLADHPCINLGDESKFDLPVFMNEHRPWMLKFDGSSTDRSAGAEIIIVSPSGAKTSLSFNLDFECTNNQSEYEALLIGLEILLDLGAKKLIESFEEVELVHVPREADELSQLASGLRLSEELTHRLVMVQRKTHPSIFKRGVQLDIFNIDDNLVQDWRRDIKKYLENPSKKMMYKVRVRAVNYVLIEDVLYRRGFDNLLLRCLGTTEALEVMIQTHEGVCGAHQSGVKMRWLIRRYGNIQRLPAAELKSVIKPWPFKGWAIDLIGKIYHPSSKNHSFIIVATDYFTKWVVGKPLVKAEQKDVIKFIKEEIIHQFGIPQSVTTDQGTMFTGKEMQEFATDYGIKLLTSKPYYAHANGQVESSNKIIINIVQKMLEENPRDWHRILSEAL